MRRMTGRATLCRIPYCGPLIAFLLGKSASPSMKLSQMMRSEKENGASKKSCRPGTKIARRATTMLPATISSGCSCLRKLEAVK